MASETVKFFPDILEEFFEELDFLWMQRESVIFAHDWTLRDLAELEDRAEAHLDGLRLSGDDGIALARPHLCGDEQGAATAATFVLMEAGRPDFDAEVVTAFETAEPAARVGIGIGLRHVDVARLAAEFRRLATDADLLTRSIAVDVLAFHRLGPPPPKLSQLFSADDPEIRARAYAAAGRFGGPWGPDELQSALDQPHVGIRWAAIHTSARLGMPGLADYLRRAVQRTDVTAPEAVEFLGVLGEPKDLQLFAGLMRRPELRGAALAALGASGRVDAVPMVLEAMMHPDTVVFAGRAFTRITGAHGIDAEKSEPVVGIEHEEERDLIDDEAVDVVKATEWWNGAQGRFTGEVRWQHGFRVDTPIKRDVFDVLPLGPRRDLFLVQARSTASNSVADPESRALLQGRTA